MSRLPSRTTLEKMKRVDLQKLCKDHGLKANLKTEALIDLLLQSKKPPQPVRPAPASTRTMSACSTGTRPRGQSGQSMVIHDTDDEEVNESENEVPEEDQPKPEPEKPVVRTRKAKETQRRLGVGRPVMAGGSGARDITKSGSVPRAKRGKGSRIVTKVEQTIQEEPEPEPEPIVEEEQAPASELSKKTTCEEIQYPNDQIAVAETSLAFLQQSDKRVAEALRPMHEQMQSFKSELGRLKAQVSEMDSLSLKVTNLTVQVETLRTRADQATVLEAEIQLLKNSGQVSEPATPGKSLRSSVKGAFTPAESSAQAGKLKDPSPAVIPSHPGFAPTMLGKRHRDSTASNVTGVVEEGEEDEYSETELAKRVVRPTKKRPKICEQESLSEGVDAVEQIQATPRVPTFTVYSGPSPQQSQDPPPPTTHLPDYFAPPSPPGNRPATATANATENQQPFNFSFLPPSSDDAMYLNSIPIFPYSEAPQSPSPAGNANDAGFGLPIRPRSGTANTTTASASGSNHNPEFVNPAMLSRTVSDREREDKRDREAQLTSNEVAAGLGLTVVRTSASDPDGTPRENRPAKRTMYGTELEGDSRFGDFGVEGVASGFWARGRF